MIDPIALRRWIEKRKKKLDQDEGGVTLPNGLVIHINLPQQAQQGQQLPLTPDGKSLSVRDTVARFPA